MRSFFRKKMFLQRNGSSSITIRESFAAVRAVAVLSRLRPAIVDVDGVPLETPPGKLKDLGKTAMTL